jgi:hypothetical protein
MSDSLRIEDRERSEQCHSGRVTHWHGASEAADAARDYVKRGRPKRRELVRNLQRLRECCDTYAPGMHLQSRDVLWAEQIPKERENASLPGVDLFLPLEAPHAHHSVPLGRSPALLTWRQLALAAVTATALVWASFHAERAVRRGQEEAAAEAAEMRQKDRERVLAEQTAEKLLRRREAEAAEQEAAQVRATAARTQLEAAAQLKAAEAAQATRRAASWDQFYKPNPSCKTSWTIDCANAYIRAKRRFEEQAN